MVLKRRELGKIHESWHEFKIPNMSELLIIKNPNKPEFITKKLPTFSSGAGIEEDEWNVHYSIINWDKITDHWIVILFNSIPKKEFTRAICSAYLIDYENNVRFIGQRGSYCNGFGLLEIGGFLKKNSDEEKKLLLPNDTLNLHIKLTILLDDITPLPGLFVIELCPKVNLPDNFIQLYDSKSNDGDITIQIKQQLFKVHRHVLEIRCPKLLDALVPSNAAQDNNIFEIIDIESQVFEKLIEFIYLDEIIDFDDHIESLIRIADKYKLEVLRRICEKNLAENFLTRKNADYIQDLATSTDSGLLHEYCYVFKKINTPPWEAVSDEQRAQMLALLEARKNTKQ